MKKNWTHPKYAFSLSVISEHLTLHCFGGGGGVGGGGGGRDGFGGGGLQIVMNIQFIVHIVASTAHGLMQPDGNFFFHLDGIREQGKEQ